MTDIDEWAAGPGRKVHCYTCENHADLLDSINQFLALKKAGNTRKSLQAFHREWLVPKGYSLSADGLRKHITRCLTNGK